MRANKDQHGRAKSKAAKSISRGHWRSRGVEIKASVTAATPEIMKEATLAFTIIGNNKAGAGAGGAGGAGAGAGAGAGYPSP